MEHTTSSDRYLHKKFKKQLTIDTTPSPLHIQRKGEIISQQSLAGVGGNNGSSVDHSVYQVIREPLHDLQQHTVQKHSAPSVSHIESPPNFVPNRTLSISNKMSSISPTTLVKSTQHHQQDSISAYSPVEAMFLVDHQRKTDHDISPATDNGSLIPSDLRTSAVSSSTINTDIVSLDSAHKSPSGKYVCTFCNLSCSKPSVLQKHIRAHTNERPYPCVSCGFSFKTRSNLYKHCRSRTHRNRVMGNNNNKSQPDYDSANSNPDDDDVPTSQPITGQSNRLYKPRFHLDATNYSNTEESRHVNTTNDSYFGTTVHLMNCSAGTGERSSEEPLNLTYKNRKRCLSDVGGTETSSAVTQTQSLIKELLLKNLYADGNMQCPHCKMIFRTVTELELHKLKNCRGFTKSGSRYNRSNSVNVASIFTQNRSHFDNVPSMTPEQQQQQRSQSIVFPLKSPGPFLGKTRLIDGDKQKSFSFEDDIIHNHLSASIIAADSWNTHKYADYSPVGDVVKRAPVKLFGGEVKITHQTSGESESFKIDGNAPLKHQLDFTGVSIRENHVVKNCLQSGGTIVQNKQQQYHSKRHKADNDDDNNSNDTNIIRVFNTSTAINQFKYNPTIATQQTPTVNSAHELMDTSDQSTIKYAANIKDFSQKAAKLLQPNLRQVNLSVPGIPTPSSVSMGNYQEIKHRPNGPIRVPIVSPAYIMADGKVVRYVPGMPGPIVADDAGVSAARSSAGLLRLVKPNVHVTPPTDAPTIVDQMEVLVTETSTQEEAPYTSNHKRFVRPNSLPLKPSTVISKQHHGLTPTMFNQILISPDTPRVAKKYNQHFLNGNYFSYLDLKSSTRSVYCTLNKTQPYYLPLVARFSMYSEWQHQDDGLDRRAYASCLDSGQRSAAYSVAGSAWSRRTERSSTGELIGQCCHTTVVQSNYTFTPDARPPSPTAPKSPITQSPPITHTRHNTSHYSHVSVGCAPFTLPHDGSTAPMEEGAYVRGRGRGRFVCDQCGIRCKKPSMLKKHIRTHTNVRPYTCSHCNFSFKTKGNLTKHMKSKAHTKNYTAGAGSSSGSGSSTHQSGNMTSDSSDDDESDLESSDESTRNQEHEAAYGLLSLSQKPGSSSTTSNSNQSRLSPLTSTAPLQSSVPFMDSEQIDHVTKSNYVRNKILTEKPFVPWSTTISSPNYNSFVTATSGYLCRPLTYPYTSPLTEQAPNLTKTSLLIQDTPMDVEKPQPTNIQNFNVIKRYDPEILRGNSNDDWRKRKNPTEETLKNHWTAQEVSVIDLSVTNNQSDGVLRQFHERMNGDRGYQQQHKQSFFVPHENALKSGLLMAVADGFDKEPAHNHAAMYDNSAMETLADIATKQVKLERNAVAKDVASEFLKLATKNSTSELGPGLMMSGTTVIPVSGTNHHHQKDVNDLMAKGQENKSCTVCGKSFNKPSQLRLHMNIHYLERPFRCESCSVSFRTKGHLQKHERSAGHHNKLCSSPTLVTSEPRPFKCVDCNIAFRIHGHLAKHLRSKMHIMKLECLSKIPFGLYAELERSNSLLTEINTSDGEQCLSSLKMLAKKVFMNDPSKLTYVEMNPNARVDIVESDN